MESHVDRLMARIRDDLFPAFAKDSQRKLHEAVLVSSRTTVTDYDARQCLRALDSGLVKDHGGGRYYAHHRTAFEQLFWQGLRSKSPRTITLWVEPVITFGVIGRLHYDLGWPEDHLGLQSKTYAFDAVAYATPEGGPIAIACEVKKSRAEVDAMIEHMLEFATQSRLSPPDGNDRRKNAFKKWFSIVQDKPEFFWAVGPGGYDQAFRVVSTDGDVALIACATEELAFRQGSAGGSSGRSPQ